MSIEPNSGPRNGVLTLTGYGLDLRVDRGHLEVTDGVADERRQFRLSRVSPDLERVVVIGHSGTVTLDALKWMQDTGVAFVQIGHDAQLITATAPEERRHAERIRAQALAQVTGGALAISRQLVASKIEGQRRVLERLPDADGTRDRLEQLEEDCRDVGSGDELLTLEAKAANEYWATWEPLEVDFDRPNREGVPRHWRRVGPRSSPLSKNARKAAAPAHAMLNYLYAVLRAETRLAIHAMGMEPGLPLFHATQRWRDSFSYDLMEPLRPLVDDFVLDLLEERTFTKSDFFETNEGVVRVMPPLSKQLSETASRWREAVGPLVEEVTREVMAWADDGQRGALTRREGNTVEGAFVPTLLTKDNYRAGGRSTQRKRERSARESWEVNQQWESQNGNGRPDIDYEEEILPGLEDVLIRRIAEATDLSMSYAAAIRNGREVPHRRHWPALLELAQEEDAERELKERFEGVDFQRDILPELQQVDATHQEIAEAVGLCRSYVSEIMRAEKVPSLDHWDDLANLGG